MTSATDASPEIAMDFMLFTFRTVYQKFVPNISLNPVRFHMLREQGARTNNGDGVRAWLIFASGREAADCLDIVCARREVTIWKQAHLRIHDELSPASLLRDRRQAH